MAKNSPQKLTVTAYKDPKFSSEVGKTSLQINPAEYSWSHSALTDHQYDPSKENNKESRPFGQLNPQTLSFDFWLDATGVTGNAVDITETLKKFKQLTCDHNGSSHGINYLIVAWGKLSFRCQLTDLKISYKLFNSKGIPLRANCNATFTEFVDAETLKARQNNQSPDLTHIYTVEAGDTLPNICYHTYGSPKYYLKVAEANNLSNFRKLKAGQKIILPPLDKSS